MLTTPDRAVERRMDELATRASRTGVVQRTGFLSPAEQAQAEIAARKAQAFYFACGGAEGAERCVVAFVQEDWDEDWPIVCLRIAWHGKYGAPGHRDLLGSILGLGIERRMVGDIFPGDGEAYVFVLREAVPYITAGLATVGRVPVQAEALPEWPNIQQGEAGKAIRATVASLRLDALLGAALKLSRAKAAVLVTSGRVQVSHVQELRPDHLIREGDIVSIRGMGRVQLESVCGKTKKGRIAVTLLRY